MFNSHFHWCYNTTIANEIKDIQQRKKAKVVPIVEQHDIPLNSYTPESGSEMGYLQLFLTSAQNTVLQQIPPFPITKQFFS